MGTLIYYGNLIELSKYYRRIECPVDMSYIEVTLFGTIAYIFIRYIQFLIR